VQADDGSLASGEELSAFAREHRLQRIAIADLVAHRRRHDKLIERVVATALPTRHGDFAAVGYRSLIDNKHHVALVMGDVAGEPDVLVGFHSRCLAGDVFHSLRCDCRAQLAGSLAAIRAEGRGVLLYLAQDSHGIDLLSGLREDSGQPVEAAPDGMSDRGIGAPMLVDLGLSSIRLLSDDPTANHGLEGFGLDVVGVVPIRPPEAAGAAVA
jgi:3,4-dihydroxy 2-butanone 4-phosphate synthase / GTP cyclohydrolase II